MLPRRPWMVGWYSPRLLLKAGIEVVVSTLFGQHADQRTVQALTGPAQMFDYSSGRREPYTVGTQIVAAAREPSASQFKEQGAPVDFWFDYVADVGDGWDSTYSIAYQLTREQLTLAGSVQRSSPVTLKQGSLLIFGGDQVYPTASREEYDRRFLRPYRTALADGLQRNDIDVFAIPGNHDWYDSLRSFSRIFFTEDAFVAGTNIQTLTETPQTRSYFAIRLPHGWWLLGTDVQLGSDIDANQLEYFKAVVREIKPQEHIILCTAEPHWLQAKRAEKRESIHGESALDRLEREVLGRRVTVFVAGDVHHYMRYQAGTGADAAHKITAGGGGAFLHPTHATWRRSIADGFRRVESATFPSRMRSRAIALRNCFFAFLNPQFGMLTATLYVVFALMLLPALSRLRDEQLVAERARYQQQIAEIRNRTEQLSEEIEALAGEPSTGEPRRPSPSEPAADLGPLSRELPRSVNIPEAAIRRLQSQYRLEEFTSEEPSDDEPPEGRREALPDAARPRVASKLREIESLATQYSQALQNDRRASRQMQEPDFVTRMSGLLEDAPPPGPDGEPIRAGQTTPSGDPSEPPPTAPPASSPPPSSAGDSLFDDPWKLLRTLTAQEARLPDPFQSMLAAIVFVSAIAGFIAFTDIPKLWGRVVLGTSHGVVHWTAAYLMTVYSPWALARFPVATSTALTVAAVAVATLCTLFSDAAELSRLARVATAMVVGGLIAVLSYFVATQEEYRSLGIAAVVFGGGWVAGSTIMGVYLLLTHTFTGQHWNEAFSSVRCKDWKCFLRFKVSPNGMLTIYPVGIRRVCRSWRTVGPHVQPASEDGIPSVLIEPPIEIRGRSFDPNAPPNP